MAKQHNKEHISFRAKFEAQRSFFDRIADEITSFFGSIHFVLFQVVILLAWVLINSNLIPVLTPFDPYPFGLLTGILTAEAVFLAVFVLISQNRTNEVNNLRDEINFQVNMKAEQEITKLINMVHDIHNHLGLEKKIDKELAEMMEKLDPKELESQIKKEAEQ